ncbi:hypothetical protein HDU88_006518 [Geranomyces variabilis]|nr:hypothetical protein HDU88_006518 [Geranomyces variabilis]
MDEDTIKLVELQLAALNAVGESAVNRTFNAIYVQQELSKYIAANYDATGLSEHWTLDQAVKRYTNIRAMHKQAVDAMAQMGGGGLPFYVEKYKWWTLMEEIHKNNESVKPAYQRDGNRGHFRRETDILGDIEADNVEPGSFEAGGFEAGNIEARDIDFNDFEPGETLTSVTTSSLSSLPATPTTGQLPKAISLRSVAKRKRADTEQSAMMEQFEEMETARRMADDVRAARDLALTHQLAQARLAVQERELESQVTKKMLEQQAKTAEITMKLMEMFAQVIGKQIMNPTKIDAALSYLVASASAMSYADPAVETLPAPTSGIDRMPDKRGKLVQTTTGLCAYCYSLEMPQWHAGVDGNWLLRYGACNACSKKDNVKKSIADARVLISGIPPPPSVPTVEEEEAALKVLEEDVGAAPSARIAGALDVLRRSIDARAKK